MEGWAKAGEKKGRDDRKGKPRVTGGKSELAVLKKRQAGTTARNRIDTVNQTVMHKSEREKKVHGREKRIMNRLRRSVETELSIRDV